MDYSRNYYNMLNISERMKKEIEKVKTPRGLGSRSELRDFGVEDFNAIRAKYVDLVRQLFTPSEEQMGVQEEGWSPDIEYMTADQAMALGAPEGEEPSPKRNPRYWKDAAFAPSMTGEDVEPILQALKIRESGGNYSAKNPKSTAAGAYQFTNSTWRSLTKKYGVGSEYTTAKSAPPEVQEAVARRYVQEILAANNNDVTKVPLVWYTGNAQGRISEEGLKANDGLTPQEYQNNWLRTYSKLIGKK